jgi:hypothetical protein
VSIHGVREQGYFVMFLVGTAAQECCGADRMIRAGAAHELHAEYVSEKFGGCRGVFDMQANMMDTGVAANTRGFRLRSSDGIVNMQGFESIVDARLLPALLQAFFLNECDCHGFLPFP